eukprot:Sspe_Gene.33940::Locus_16516_Transcript_1_1_Confidence_1.000_Length_641::g.33940::m.33940
MPEGSTPLSPEELEKKRQEVARKVAEAKEARELEEQKASKFGTHVGITCDGCGAVPVVGFRWHCKNCKNHDLCDTCHSSWKGGVLPHNNKANPVSTVAAHHSL